MLDEKGGANVMWKALCQSGKRVQRVHREVGVAVLQCLASCIRDSGSFPSQVNYSSVGVVTTHAAVISFFGLAFVLCGSAGTRFVFEQVYLSLLI